MTERVRTWFGSLFRRKENSVSSDDLDRDTIYIGFYNLTKRDRRRLYRALGRLGLDYDLENVTYMADNND